MVELIYKNNNFYIKKGNDLGFIYNNDKCNMEFKTLDEIIDCDYIIYESGYEIKDYILIHKEDDFIQLLEFISNRLLRSNIKLIIKNKRKVKLC